MSRLVPRAALAALAFAAAVPAPAAAQTDDFDLSALDVPPGFLELSDLEVSGPRPGVIIATATTTLLGNVTSALVSSFTTAGAGRGLVFALKPTDWSLTRTIPALENPILDELTFDYVGLVLANRELSLPSSSLSPEERAFYREIYQSDSFTLTVKPGINLIAAIPAEDLPPAHPLNVVMDALGIEKGTILIQGTLGRSLSLIGAPGAGGLDVIRDLYLRAELPPMRPPGSPEWFNSGQLALEITGLPSLRLVGEMNVNIQEDELMFFVAADLARTGMTLSGGMTARDDGWEQPFGIEWLTLNSVALMLGITPAGSVQLGFAGDAVFGEKDIAVAVAIAISAAGVPTNFMIDGESEAGVSLGDIADVQARMTAAANGGPGSRIPVGALPAVAIAEMRLKFAPRPEPALGIERGMAINGRLHLPLTPDGELTDFAGVDVSVGDAGFWARGDVGAFTLGPLTVEDSELDLTATLEEQYLIVKGAADLLGARQALDIEFSRTNIRFTSRTVLWDVFMANLDAQAAFDLRDPRFHVRAEMQNDFGEAIAPLVTGGLSEFAAGGADLLAEMAARVEELDAVLANREADVERIRQDLQRIQAEADRAWNEARESARTLQARAAATKRSADSARRAYAGTPARQPVVRAQRRATWRAIHTRWQVQARAANGALALAASRERVRNALPPLDQNILVLGAEEALGLARQHVQTTRSELEAMQERYGRIVDALEQVTLPFTVERASFESDLGMLMAGAAGHWNISGTFLGAPYLVERTIDFSDMVEATAALLQELIG